MIRLKKHLTIILLLVIGCNVQTPRKAKIDNYKAITEELAGLMVQLGYDRSEIPPLLTDTSSNISSEALINNIKAWISFFESHKDFIWDDEIIDHRMIYDLIEENLYKMIRDFNDMDIQEMAKDFKDKFKASVPKIIGKLELRKQFEKMVSLLQSSSSMSDSAIEALLSFPENKRIFSVRDYDSLDTLLHTMANIVEKPNKKALKKEDSESFVIRVKRFRMLIDKAAELDPSSFKIRNKKGKTSFLIACEKDRGVTILESKLRHNIKKELITSTDNDNNNCIHILAQFDGEKTLAHINTKYENQIRTLVNKENSVNNIPLHMCGGSKKNTIIILNRLLKTNKSKINNINKEGDAPIHCIVKALKKPFEPVNQSDMGRVAKLHPAYLSLEELINAGANKNIRDRSGKTPLELLESLESEIIDKHNSKSLIKNCKSIL